MVGRVVSLNYLHIEAHSSVSPTICQWAGEFGMGLLSKSNKKKNKGFIRYADRYPVGYGGAYSYAALYTTFIDLNYYIKSQQFKLIYFISFDRAIESSTIVYSRILTSVASYLVYFIVQLRLVLI